MYLNYYIEFDNILYVYVNFYLIFKVKDKMFVEEFECYWVNFDGNLWDIMDMVIKELKSDEDGMKLR